MGKELQVLQGYLERGDKRFTQQRRKIMEEAFATHEHFSVDDLEARFRKRGEHVSKATIYRTLALLKEIQLIEEHDFGRGAKYYEHIYGHRHHDHLICLKCGKIEEFRNNRIEALQDQVARTKKFKVSHHIHKIFGTCEPCQRKTKEVK